MKAKSGFLVIALILFMSNIYAQDVTTVEATDINISENLDLEAVASVFGEAEDLEDFEKRLNDPEAQISNLDLNGDGEVDYLRVVESSKDEVHLVTIQAVIEKDIFQDVAVIDVEKDNAGTTQVQVVGDVYMYGPEYIITPVYVHPPVVVVWFWGPYYNPWRSPYYYGYYPPYYRPWRPYPTPRYRTNVHVHVNVNNSYNRTTVRKSNTSVQLQNKSRRNDYGSKNPDRSYARTKDGAKGNQPTARPATKPAVQPKATPAAQPTARPATKPAVQPKATPAAQPAARPTARPTAKPAAKPSAKPAAKSKSRSKKR